MREMIGEAVLALEYGESSVKAQHNPRSAGQTGLSCRVWRRVDSQQSKRIRAASVILRTIYTSTHCSSSWHKPLLTYDCIRPLEPGVCRLAD
jgi:hypothetical protein